MNSPRDSVPRRFHRNRRTIMQRLYRVGLLVVSLVVPAAFGVEAERAIPHPARTQMAAGGERQASLQLSRDLIVVAVLAALQHAAGREKPAARPDRKSV